MSQVRDSKTAGRQPRPGGRAGAGQGQPAAPDPMLDSKPGEIGDMRDLPQGEYRRLPDDNARGMFSERFAVLVSGERSATLLSIHDAYGSHAMFELRRRLRDEGIENVAVRLVTREILRAVHVGNASRYDDIGAGKTRVEEIAWSLIERAIAVRASDIHLEMRGAFAQVYFRIHGERIEQPNMAGETAREVCNVLYSVHADATSKDVTWDPATVQDSSIEYTTQARHKVQLRFSSGPIYPSGCFHAVIRLLIQDETDGRALEDLGFSEAQLAAVQRMLIGAQGMVLVVGPTNSGKSTTLQALLRRIYGQRGSTIKVLTVEDPVEYRIPDACQMGVPRSRKSLEDRRTGSVYTTFLRGTLRQDPDVVLIGEIRDLDSAVAVKDLVLSGRKVLTTLHAYDAVASFARLRELGVPASVLFMPGFVSGVIYQRLVPVLCPACSVPIGRARVSAELLGQVSRVADLRNDDVRVRGEGCNRCDFAAIAGRSVCAEVVVPDIRFLTLLSAGNEIEARRHWRADADIANGGTGGGRSAVAHAIAKMRTGLFDPADIERQVGSLTYDYAETPATFGNERVGGK